jgi:hypothetical protein
MMTKKRPIPACAALLATIILGTTTVSAQGTTGPPALPPTSPLLPQIEEGPEITVTSDGGGSIKATTLNRSSEQIGLRPNQQVDVSVQYGVTKAGHLIAVIPLDGGLVPGSDKKFTVGLDGALRFKFKAGGQPGVYQVSLHEGAKEIGIRFWVLEEQDPRKNPPVLAGN